MSRSNQKVATISSLLSIYIFEILRKYSNKDHPMTEKEIKEKLKETADIELSKDDRNSIPRHTRALVAHLPGLVVETKPKTSKANEVKKWYYDGSKARHKTILAHNYCTPNEIKFLVDMVSSTQLLSSEANDAFVSKLLNSLNIWDKEKITAQLQKSANDYKNENDFLRSVRNKLTDAIDGEKSVEITFESDGKEQVLSASVHKVSGKDGMQYVYAVSSNHIEEIALSQIKKVVYGKTVPSDDLVEERLSALGIIDDRSLDSNIEIDTLFSNIEQINRSIADKKYLTFNDYRSRLLASDTEMPTRTIIPLKTVFQNGKYYLIAVEKSVTTNSSAFIRIDLMENVRIGRKLTNRDALMSDTQNANSYLNTDPYIIAKTNQEEITFYIKKEAAHRAFEAFGNSPYAEDDVSPLKTVTGIRQKIAEHDPEFFTKEFTGFDASEELIEVKANATEEDAIRWALENADAVEIKSPEHLRLKLKEMSNTLHTRYSKKEYDIFEEQYRKVLSGEEYLVYGGSSKYQDRLIKRIIEENAYDKITKLAIENRCPLSMKELEKYVNIESLRIEGDAITDFSFLTYYTQLKQLTLIGTSMEDGSVLTKIPNLEVLFIHRNKISDYSFLKGLKNVSVLYLGQNETTDLSPLYELDGIEELVLEEDVLASLDIEKIMFGGKCHMVHRWIDDGWYRSFPKRYGINHKLLRL
ncbi:MAG: WYL domain-containing protein [Clostridia bacterium]|nr:WYL domain-containing protein [Clostridia bacterium]